MTTQNATQNTQDTHIAMHTQDTQDTPIHITDLFARLNLPLVNNGISYTGRHHK